METSQQRTLSSGRKRSRSARSSKSGGSTLRAHGTVVIAAPPAAAAVVVVVIGRATRHAFVERRWFVSLRSVDVPLLISADDFVRRAASNDVGDDGNGWLAVALVGDDDDVDDVDDGDDEGTADSDCSSCNTVAIVASLDVVVDGSVD